MALTACGGGGGGITSTTTGVGTATTTPVTAPVAAAPVVTPSVPTTTTITPVPAPVAAPTSVAIVNTAPPTTTYAVGSEELAAFNYINTERLNCGFGSLRQNASLDSAAASHSAWMINNNTVGHYEVVNTPGFTGVDPGARMTAVGYKYVVGSEVLTYASNTKKLGFGLSGIKDLFAAPYHLIGLLSSNREIGISATSGGPAGSGADLVAPLNTSPSTNLVVDMASNTTYLPQVQGSNDVLTYPCQGSTNVTPQMTGTESPTPILNRNFTTNPIGQPIVVQVATGNKLVITTLSLVTTIGSIPSVIATTLTSATDLNYEVQPSQAVIIPDTPLAHNTQYTVTIQGTNNGALFVKNFTFTTGA